MEILSNSTQETKKLAYDLAKKMKPGMVVALFGDIGAGKTTFVNYLAKALGFTDRVQSPTFVLIRHYKDKKSVKNVNDDTCKINSINHVDLYRLSLKEELFDLGLFEIINNNDNLTLIEWPELVMEFLPQGTPRISFFVIGEGKRRIVIENL